MSAIRVYYLFVGYIIYLNFNSFIIIFLYGQMVGNIFELRLFLYLVYVFYKVVISSPFGMNIVTCSVLMVERMINMFGIGLIYIAIYIRFKY